MIVAVHRRCVLPPSNQLLMKVKDTRMTVVNGERKEDKLVKLIVPTYFIFFTSGPVSSTAPTSFPITEILLQIRTGLKKPENCP